MNRSAVLKAGRSGRRRRTRGAETVEFTLNFLPMLAMIILVADTGWAIFAHAVLQQAVRFGVRTGVTLTASQVTTDLTSTVKGIVQSHAVGLLNGTTGYGYIKVHYFDASNPSTDVSGQSYGNTAGNIMQVSVENLQLNPLIARVFSWKGSVDKNPMSVSVYAADIIEPSNNPPPIGTAP